MDWTGERFIPGVGDTQLAYEHFARYLFASALSAGKRVLDIGSGEGYGTFLLSRDASCAVGIDVAEDAVGHAKRRYRYSNLAFEVSPAEKISLDGAFDLVTCFEVIEHLAEDHQHEMLSEVRRLLKEDGLFLVSTPNKHVYRELDRKDEDNPYHLREMSFAEFRCLLEPYFGHILWYGQQMMAGSYLHTLPIDGPDPAAETKMHVAQVVDNQLVPKELSKFNDPKYFLALCSMSVDGLARLDPPGEFTLVDCNGSLISDLSGIVDRLSEVTLAQDEKIRQLAVTLEERTEWARRSDSRLVEQEATIKDLAEKLEERTAWAQSLRSEIDQKECHVVRLENRIDDLNARSAEQGGLSERLEQENDRLRTQCRDLQHQTEGSRRHIRSMSNRWSEMDGELKRLDQSPDIREEEVRGVIYALREKVEYQLILNAIREVVLDRLPQDATVMVLSKGDDDLLNLGGRQAWHFPQVEDGSAIYHLPTSGLEIIENLESLRSKGGKYLLIPSFYLWWLEEYKDFQQYLETHFLNVCPGESVCAIYEL